MVSASVARFCGMNIGCTVRRCAECFGSSMAMKLSRAYTGFTSWMPMPPRCTSEENIEWLVSTCMMSLYLVIDQ